MAKFFLSKKSAGELWNNQYFYTMKRLYDTYTAAPETCSQKDLSDDSEDD